MSQHTQTTSRERILAALRGQEVDYVPCCARFTWNGPDATREAVREVMGVFSNRNLILAPCVSAHSIMP